jgi:MFS family permease
MTVMRLWDPRRLGLPRVVWRLELGALVNSLGTGFVFPFSVIYFHNIRGFSLGTAGLIVAVVSGGTGIISGPVAGALTDRLSARAVLLVSLGLMAVGYTLFPFVRTPWQALVAAVVAGAGNGAFYPSQASLLASLSPATARHIAFSVQRTVYNLGSGIGGLLGGLIASISSAGSFDVLFFINAATFVLYMVVLTRITSPGPAPGSQGVRRYRAVLRDRPFLGILLVNAALITFGYAIFETLTPVYSRNYAGVSETAIGIFFLINTWLIVVLQMPIARAIEGRRRMHMVLILAVSWSSGMLMVLAAGSWLSGATAAVLIGAAFVLFSVGESVQGTVVSPMAADLAPRHLEGRYMALVSFTWQLGLAVGPATGGFLLGASPVALWGGAAVVCLLAGIYGTVLQRSLPKRAGRTPRSLTPIGSKAVAVRFRAAAESTADTDPGAN